MDQSRTVLLFGELDDDGAPQSALVHFGHDAYDHYMVAPYARELLMVRNSDYVCWSPCFEHLYAAIVALDAGAVQFEELGSTLYSTIDKLEKLKSIHGGSRRSVEIDYVGIEISPLLIGLAGALHPNAKLRHYATWRQAPRSTPGLVSRSYQSTSYACRETEELFDWMSQAKFGIHGVWWSLDGVQREFSGAGNRMTLFDPDRFALLAREANIGLKVIKSETFSFGKIPFSASWIMLDNMSADEARAMRSVLRELRLPSPEPVCELSTAALEGRPYAGEHAGFIPIRTGQAFNFFGAELLSKWSGFLNPSS